MQIFRLVVVLIASMPPVAHAIVGGTAPDSPEARVDPNLAASPWAGVGAVVVNGATFSGALVDSQYVLTAAHVVGGSAPEKVKFVLNADGPASQTLAAESIHIYPGYKGTTAGADGAWHDDLALVKLVKPAVAGVPIYPLYGGAVLGQTVTMVGYGGGGDGVNGVTRSPDSTKKRVGQNRIDDVLRDDDGGTHDEILVFDFDGPDATSNVLGASTAPYLSLGTKLEAQFAGGDSGGPAFISDNGVWKLAGIATFNGSTSGLPGSNVKFGAIGGGTLVAPYAAWIEETVSSPVPEPQNWVMLLAGLGLIGFFVRRKTGHR